MLIGSLLLKVLAQVLSTIGIYDLKLLWDLSAVCWTIGLLVILIKALNSEKLKGFLEE